MIPHFLKLLHNKLTDQSTGGSVRIDEDAITEAANRMPKEAFLARLFRLMR
jgi:hypothetical protein